MQTGPSRTHRGLASAQSGVAYLALLAAVAVMATVAASTLRAGSVHARRDAEAELLALGTRFQRALESYAAATPVGGEPQPRALQHLLRDPRTAGLRRHLRRVPVDPLTGRAEWGLVRDAGGGIVAIHSLASGTPIKRTGFALWQAHFEEAARYADWVFGPPDARAAARLMPSPPHPRPAPPAPPRAPARSARP